MGRERKITEGMCYSFSTVLRKFYCLLIGIILVLCLLSKQISYRFDQETVSNLMLLPLGIFFVFLLYKFSSKVSGRVESFMSSSHSWIYFVLLWILQTFVVYSYYFQNGWDAGMLEGTAFRMTHGKAVESIDYYSRYPNNLFLLSVFVGMEKLLHAIGLHNWEYISILAVSCAINVLTGLLVWRVLRRAGKEKEIALTGYLLYFIVIGCSPWVSIPYSDSFGLLFPILEYDLHLILKTETEKRKRTGIYIVLGIVGALGYQIKPQLIFAFCAIVVAEAVAIVKKEKQERNITGLIGITVGFLVGKVISDLCIASLNFALDSNASFGPAHFLMMGLNASFQGSWNAEDVAFSASFPLKSERTLANLQEAWNRLKSLGGIGLLQLFARKMLSNFNDGTFSWGMEGYFFVYYPGARIPRLSYFMQSFYYCGDYEGKFYGLWKNIEETVWMGILGWNLFSGIKNSARGKSVAILMPSVIMLAVFEMIFECRARYLFSYVPFFIILALECISNVNVFFKEKVTFL